MRAVCVSRPPDPFQTPLRSGLPSAVRGIGPAGAGGPPPRPWAEMGIDITTTTTTSAAIVSRRRPCVLMVLLRRGLPRLGAPAGFEVSRPRVGNAHLVQHVRALIVEDANVF